MVKIIRIPARKVNFNDEKIKKPMLDRKEKEINLKEKQIKKKFSDLKKAEEIVNQIQNQINTQTTDIQNKEQELIKMANLWGELNNLNLSSLNQQEVNKIANSQKGFIADLLKHYLDSTRNEKEYLRKIEKLEKQPEKNSVIYKDIENLKKENEELKQENKKLLDELDNAINEIEKLEVS